MSDFSNPAGQGGFGAHSKAIQDSQFMHKQDSKSFEVLDHEIIHESFFESY